MSVGHSQRDSGGTAVTEAAESVCEDRQRSLKVLGCGLVTAGVTPGMTGDAALLRPVRSWSPAPARLEELA